MTQEATEKKIRMAKTRKKWLLFVAPLIVFLGAMSWFSLISDIIDMISRQNMISIENYNILLLMPFCFVICVYCYVRVISMSEQQYQEMRNKFSERQGRQVGIGLLVMTGLSVGGYLVHDWMGDFLKANGYTLCTEDDGGRFSSRLWVKNSAWEICIDERYT